MALISLRQLLDHAAENTYGVPAFNVNNMEQVIAVMKAADKTNSPVIMQASRGARSYASDVMLRHMLQAAIEMYPHIPVVLHQDHGNNVATCLSAIQFGYSSAMMDGSLMEDANTPSSYEYNVAITAKVAEMAHMVGVSVEGELGVLGSLETGQGEKEDGHGASGTLTREQLLTNPDQAIDFVSRTKVDALAIAMGTSHGAYKFSRKPDRSILAMDVLQSINRRLPNIHLVMHGSSSVPQELLELIRQYGGDIRPTWGVPVEEIQLGIKNGVRKINIDTDTRLAITGQFRKVAQEKKSEFDPRAFFKPATEAMQKLCEQRYIDFGTAGQASKIKPLPLSEMAARYRAGKLEPQIAEIAKVA